MRTLSIIRLPLLTTLATLPACGDPIDAGNENEVITTVGLTFTPEGGGLPLTFELDDRDGDGGDPPTVDTIDLPPDAYTMEVFFENRLEDPAEDITEEVLAEAEEHQIFFTGSAVDGPAAANPGASILHAYADEDSRGLPVGLTSTVTVAAGTGELVVTLRHLPPVDDQPVKTSTLAAEVRDGGFAAIGGTTDARATFPVSVQ